MIIRAGSRSGCKRLRSRATSVADSFSQPATDGPNSSPPRRQPASPGTETARRCHRSWSPLPCPSARAPGTPWAAFPQRFLTGRKSEGARHYRIGFCSVKAPASCLIYIEKSIFIYPAAWQLFGIRSVTKEPEGAKEKISLQIRNLNLRKVDGDPFC